MPRKSGIERRGIIDLRIANAIRTLRIMRGLTQEGLAQKLSITFQQVQKYEKACTRVSSSRLYEIAHVLGTPIEIFFLAPEGAGDGDSAIRDVVDLYRDFPPLSAHREFVELNRAYVTLPSAEIRAAVMNLVRDIASTTESAPAVACEQRMSFRHPSPQRRCQISGEDCCGPEGEEASGPLATTPERSEYTRAID